MAVGWDSKNSVLFIFLTVVCAVGVLGLLLFKQPDAKHHHTSSSAEQHLDREDDRTLAAQAKATVALMATRELVSLIPLFTFTGVQYVLE